MIQDIAPHVFHNEYRPHPIGQEDAVVCYDGDRLLMDVTAGEDAAVFPLLKDFTPGQQTRIRESHRLQYLFSIDETGYIWTPVDLISGGDANGTDGNDAANADGGATGADRQISIDGRTLAFLHIQKLRSQTAPCVAHAMMVSYHLHTWTSRSRFCGHCGSATVPHPAERAFLCESCGSIFYPQIAPAVAVAVIDTKNDRILLAKGLGDFKKFALIAGYVEIGETVEECVHREVMEEVGLQLGKLHYFASQPWGLTGIEMMGFFAELAGDDRVTIQETELSAARWFSREELTEEPTASLSFTLIDAFRRGDHLRWMK